LFLDFLEFALIIGQDVCRSVHQKGRCGHEAAEGKVLTAAGALQNGLMYFFLIKCDGSARQRIYGLGLLLVLFGLLDLKRQGNLTNVVRKLDITPSHPAAASKIDFLINAFLDNNFSVVSNIMKARR